MKSNFVPCKKHARLKQALVCTATLAGFILFTGPTFSAHADTNSTPTNTQNSGATTDNGTAVLKNNVTNSDSVHTGDVANDDVSSDTNSPTDNSGNDTDNGNSSTHGTTETATTDSDPSGQQAADATDQSTTSTTASGPVATTDSHNQSLNDPLTSKEMYYYEPTNDPTESPWSTAIPFHYLNDPNDPTKALPYDDPGYDNTYFYPTAKGWKGYVYYYTDNSERGAALEKAGWYPLTTYVEDATI